MMRISLTARLSLLFMLAVTAVLVLAGLSFNHLSQHHFLQLDRQTLAEKLSDDFIGRVCETAAARY